MRRSYRMWTLGPRSPFQLFHRLSQAIPTFIHLTMDLIQYRKEGNTAAPALFVGDGHEKMKQAEGLWSRWLDRIDRNLLQVKNVLPHSRIPNGHDRRSCESDTNQKGCR